MKTNIMLGAIALLVATACGQPVQPEPAEFTATPVLEVDTTVINFHGPNPPANWLLLLEDPTGYQRQYTFTTDKDGNASISIPVAGTTPVWFYGGNFDFAATTWLAPGETVKMNITKADDNTARIVTDGMYSGTTATEQSDDYLAIYQLIGNDLFKLPIDCDEAQYADFIISSYKAHADSIAANASWSDDAKRLGLLTLQSKTMGRAASPDRWIAECAGVRNLPAPEGYPKFTELTDSSLRRIGSLFDTGNPELIIMNAGNYKGNQVNWADYGATTSLPADFALLRKMAGWQQDNRLTDADIDTLTARTSQPFFPAALMLMKQESPYVK